MNPAKIKSEFVKYINQTLYSKLCVRHKYFTLSSAPGNCEVMISDGQIVSCCYFLDDEQFTIIGKKCDIIGPFTNYPTDSSVFNLLVINFKNDILEFSAKDIICKGVILPFEENFVFAPLIHLL